MSSNSRIAKNTMLLYFRMLLVMGVSLYTSRVVLATLGVEDFGIYNVVGGVVSMLSLISGSMSAAISRFITFELGRQEKDSECEQPNQISTIEQERGKGDQLNKIFCSAVTIQLILSVVVLVVAESAGLWFVNCKMNIPEARMEAANWVLHFSLITFCINLINVPYNATIIAHERMSAFAYISVIEVIGKLSIAYAVAISPIDNLIFYAILMCGLAVFLRFCYGWYCKHHFYECQFHFLWDKELLKKMFGFAGWNFIGASSAVLRDQGGNIVINLFCGPAVNAARGIAIQVSNAVQSFVQNFMTALNPQITKNYASENYEYMFTLIFQGARLSFYMLLLLSLPILLNTRYVLSLWLEEVPEHTVLFVQLILVFAMSESLSNPLITSMLATGKIRNYQIVVGGLQMLNLPFSYMALKLGAIPETVIIVAIIISQCCMLARLIMLRDIIHINVSAFIIKVYCNVLYVAIIATIAPLMLKTKMEESFSSFIFISASSVFCTIVVVMYLGCNSEERQLVFNKLRQVKNKILKQ